jgi:hypothetical protein
MRTWHWFLTGVELPFVVQYMSEACDDKGGSGMVDRKSKWIPT